MILTAFILKQKSMKASNFLNSDQQKMIVSAIKEAELNTSGEIRLHIETKCKIDVLDRASQIFSQLKMHKTKLRNGVLFYLSIEDKQFAILGDGGINAKVAEDFWQMETDLIIQHFKENQFAEGLAKGIIMAGEQLKKYFPYQEDDVNELSDDISFGK